MCLKKFACIVVSESSESKSITNGVLNPFLILEKSQRSLKPVYYENHILFNASIANIDTLENVK